MSYTDFDFPHSDYYRSDLRQLIAEMKKLEDDMTNFIHNESITFAEPITWSITTQYSKNTIVLNTEGNAYLSKVAVPSGIQLNNDDYWLEIFNFTNYTRTANRNLTLHVETNTTRATEAYESQDWLIWNDKLYKVMVDIAVDDLLVVGENIVRFTVEEFCRTWVDDLQEQYEEFTADIEASELEYRQQLAQDITDTTASLQAQLNAAISGVTVDSEVINARIGADGVTYSTLGDAIRTQMTTRLNDLGNFTRASFVSRLTSCDDLPHDTIVRIIGAGGQSTIPGAPSNAYCTIITIGGTSTAAAQYFIENASPFRVFSRIQATSGGVPYWQDWHRINLDESALKNLGTTSVTDFVTNYTSFDNMPGNTIIRLVTYSGTQEIPGSPSNILGTLITLEGTYKCQYYIENKGPGNIYSRYQQTSSGSLIWVDWRALIDDEYVIDKNATDEDAHTSLLDGLLYCYAHGVSRVRVKPGLYNMVDEYEATYGTSWDNDIGENNGIPLRNISIIFEAGAKVEFNYEGGRENIHRHMSLFYTTATDCYVEGLDLECANLRYGIHDECGGSTAAYSHIFKNCRIIKTDNNADWSASYTIGGGLGMNGNVEIEGGIYKCENLAQQTQTDTMYYHNNSTHEGTNSKVRIHGIYCYGPVGSVHSGGQVQNDGSKADMFVYACRFNRAPRLSSADAFNLYAWSNTIETD